MRWYVAYVSAAERAATLRKNIEGMRNPELIERATKRAEFLEQWSRDEQSSVLGKPLVDRAPALVTWAQKVQQDKGRPALERAAAYEVEALAWEEAGEFEKAWRARRNAALEAGARLDNGNFHTEPLGTW